MSLDYDTYSPLVEAQVKPYHEVRLYMARKAISGRSLSPAEHAPSDLLTKISPRAWERIRGDIAMSLPNVVEPMSLVDLA